MNLKNILKEDVIVGDINFSDIMNEDTLADKAPIRKLNNCIIEVRSREGFNVPHFHITNGEYDACIMIFNNKYFNHNDECNDKLTSRQCKELEKWMNQPTTCKKKPAGINLNNWQMMQLLWNQYHNTNYNREQPNYSTISVYR